MIAKIYKGQIQVKAMARMGTERKRQVLQYICEVRDVKGDPVVKEYNLPVWVKDKQAARSLVREEILAGDSNNDEGDCFRAGYRFAEGLRRYCIISGKARADAI